MAEHRENDWTGNLQWRHTSRRFVQAGTDGATVAPRGSFSAALATGWQGATIGVTWVRQSDWGGGRQSFVSANLARQLGAWGTLGLFALHDRTNGATTLALNLNFALDGRTSGSMTSTRGSDRGHTTNALQVQRSIEDGEGFGYELVAEQGLGRRVAAQAQLRSEHAAVSAGVARAGDREALRAGLSTGLAWLGDSVFVARRIEGSFAVVEVGDYADVRVLHDQRQVARTDRHGRALVPGLRGYEPNRIAVEAADLPFDAEVDALEVELVPPARSGVAFSVPVRRSRSASFRIVDAAGVPLPAGSQMHVAGRTQSYPVGYDGRAFVSGLGTRTHIEADWPGGRCGVELQLDGQADELPDLGTLSCR
jgi:outer membrane usher protein